jgi:uncharacterized protein GlcG (DUF336 family)
MPISLAEARTIIEAGLARARELGQRVAIAVVDEAGNPISLDKMDGAALYRDRFAVGKAFAAVLTQQPTTEAMKLEQTAPERFYGMLNLFPERIYLLSGGVPLRVDGRIVGAVGVAGGATGMDEQIAEAGIAAWQAQR